MKYWTPMLYTKVCLTPTQLQSLVTTCKLYLRFATSSMMLQHVAAYRLSRRYALCGKSAEPYDAMLRFLRSVLHKGWAKQSSRRLPRPTGTFGALALDVIIVAAIAFLLAHPDWSLDAAGSANSPAVARTRWAVQHEKCCSCTSNSSSFERA